MITVWGQATRAGSNPVVVEFLAAAIVVIPVVLTGCGNPPQTEAPAAKLPTAEPTSPSTVPSTPTHALQRSTIAAPAIGVTEAATRHPAADATVMAALVPTAVAPPPSPTPAPTVLPTTAAIPMPAPTVDLAQQIDRGEQLVSRNRCLECHTIDGQANFAPTLAGLFGTLRELEGGQATTADEKYLRESIISPDEKVVAGFGTGTMPKVFFSDPELTAMVEYIKSLE